MVVVVTVADLRDLDAIQVDASEIVYAYVSLAGEASLAGAAPPAGEDLLDRDLLDSEELERSRRFVKPSDRRRFVMAHAALRLVLARTLGVAPVTVVYEQGPHGKPCLGPGLPPLQFNLSHSGELCLVAVARDRPLGVDVEEERELTDLLDLAEQNFSLEERAGLRSLPPGERRSAFFRCWTRKEAVIKALGEGLSYPLDSFDVELGAGSTSALRRYDGRAGNEAALSLRDLAAPAGYAAAGAVAAPSNVQIAWRELPL